MGDTIAAAEKNIRVQYGASVVTVTVPVEATPLQIVKAAAEQHDLHIDLADVESTLFDGKEGQVVTNNTEEVEFVPSTRTNG